MLSRRIKKVTPARVRNGPSEQRSSRSDTFEAPWSCVVLNLTYNIHDPSDIEHRVEGLKECKERKLGSMRRLA